MKELNLNKLSNQGISITIDENTYSIKFIPFIVEKDIYTNMSSLTEKFQDPMNKILDEDWDNMYKWIGQILGHPKNNANFDEKILDNIGTTEIIMIMIQLVTFISERIVQMSSAFGSDAEKKAEPEIQ
jgi:hypothetical protein